MSRETLKERLEDSFCRWDKELLSGGSDPYYTDGQNMNLLRNHIISAKYDMKEAGEFPEIYHRKTPEKLPEHFMQPLVSSVNVGTMWTISIYADWN